MHGREVDDKKRVRYMRSGSSGAVGVDSNGSIAGSLVKDIHKINVGDCALFKPLLDSPPFIGIIRSLASDKENNIRFGVNWLYRPAEVKLGKGVALEAAPNEVFYSFHRDEIPAASLLHRCKVAFLPKGVELPAGISSFVCWRVYDITNRRLWWLTDRDYIDDWQEEVDQLLRKTRLEMHATVQQHQGRRSPKPVNVPMSASQLKHSTDSVQNSAASFPSQAKGKKRERADQTSQTSESVKRERSSRIDDGDSGCPKSESMLKSEIAKITEKGGLIDFDGVERLVQLMQPEKGERKIDLTCRCLLAGVIAATDKHDCLNRFVQLKGLPVLDEWLQEVHRGKIIDLSSPKDSDRSVEDFIFVLLRALDKLPVNLNALQTCHIGRSVNHLRSHRNPDIQKKARSLVDTWKKRVEAEMSSNDSKSGSSQPVPWPSRSRHEVSHGGNRHPGGSSDAGARSSLLQLSSSKSAAVKLIQGETIAKSVSASASLGASKLTASPASASREVQPRMSAIGGSSEPPQVATREDKGSSCSQSRTNSPCSNDHAKNLAPSEREDARSSTYGSASVSKVTGNSSRNRRSANGLQGVPASGLQREAGSSRNSSMTRISPAEKLAQSPGTGEKNVDAHVVDGNNHKLIVKIPNRGRSPAQSVSGGCIEDPSFTNSRASSPIPLEKHDNADRDLKEKNDAYRTSTTSDVSTESWQSTDLKDVLTGSDDEDVSGAAAAPSTGDDLGKMADAPDAAPLTDKNETKSRKSHDSSFSSINALIESCVKYSEANPPISAGDDIGMNLLASVATGEITQSEANSPAGSPQRNAVALEQASQDDNDKSKTLHCDNPADDQRKPRDSARSDSESQNTVAGVSCPNEGPTDQSVEPGKCAPQKEDTCSRPEKRSGELVFVTSLPVQPGHAINKTAAAAAAAAVAEQPHEKKAAVKEQSHVGEMDRRLSSGCLDVEGQVTDASSQEENQIRPSNYSSPSLMAGVSGKENSKNLRENSDAVMEHKPPIVAGSSESMTNSEVGKVSSGIGRDFSSEMRNDGKSGNTDAYKAGAGIKVEQGGNMRIERQNDASAGPQKQEDVVLASIGSDEKNKVKEEVLEAKDASVHVKDRSESKGSKLAAAEGEDVKERASMSADASSSPAAGSSGTDGKLEFDLNEGFNVDEGKYGEPICVSAPGCSGPVCFISPLPSFTITSSASIGPPASITVAAPAKGPFLPREDLLRNKGELGWKGSAATSAFRPAEPRKVTEMLSNSGTAPNQESTAGKQVRPPLEIDLNVADERVLEEMDCQNPSEPKSNKKSDYVLTGGSSGTSSIRSAGGLDLDLNRVEEVPELGQPLTNNIHRLDIHIPAGKLSLSGGLSNGKASAQRDFDLNDGPTIDELEPSSYNQQRARVNIPAPVTAGLRINNPEMGNLSSWYSPGTAFPAIPMPSTLTDRGEQPFPIGGTGVGPPRILGGPTGNIPFNPDVYRGSVLSSSPAVPFPTSPFQYPVFPFGTSFPLTSSTLPSGSTAFMDLSSGGRLCIPAVPSQLVGAGTAVSTQYPRPYVVSLPDLGNNIFENNRKWGRQGLDLNAGPGGPDIEGRDETLPVPSRHVPGVNPLALADEQSRMYQLAGGVLKRKEPEGGWDSDRISYKQPSWQ